MPQKLPHHHIKKNIEDYGGFINIGHPTCDGLLHCREIIWTDEKIDPSHYLQVGQSIDVLIIRIREEDRTKISLSAKALIPPPDRAVNIFRVDKNEVLWQAQALDKEELEDNIEALHKALSNYQLVIKDKNKVMFIPAERFMYQFVRSIKLNEKVKFK